MTYTIDNIKYCLLSWNSPMTEHIASVASKDLTISGLYNWAKLFKGKFAFPRTREEFSEFNLVHINITTSNLPLLSKVIPLIDRNKTKIIVNVDYAIELWSKNLNYPSLLFQELDKADFIFAVEPIMAQTLSAALSRHVACIPHPVPVAQLKKMAKKKRNYKIIANIHRYDTNYLIPSLAIDIASLSDKFISTVAGIEQSARNDYLLHLYDEYLPYCSFQDFIHQLSYFYVAIDSYTMHSYGRFSAECAALAIPCIGPSSVYSQCICFPSLTCSPNDIPSMSKILSDLCSDKDLWSTAAKHAREKSEFFSFDNCLNLMLSFINEGPH